MSSTKRCTKCGETKSLDEFHRNRRKPLGRHSYCRACRREYNRIWREANRDRYREYQREYQRIWRESNRDRYREYRRKYNAANRDRRREYSRAWYEANRDHHLECVRAWYEANRDRHREAKHRRRARKRSTAVEEFSLADVYAWWEELGAYNCFWCDLPFAEGDRIHVDHVWPLSRGGHHAVRNLVPACERCNLAKHASLPHEFAERAYREWLTSTSE